MGKVTMFNWSWSRSRRLAVWPLLLAGVAACGAEGSEKGVLPQGAPQGEVAALEYDAAAGRLLKAHTGGLYQSSDQGASWQAIPLPATVGEGKISTVAAADSGRVLYVAGPGIGVLRSPDGGETWVARTSGLPSRAVAAFAAHSDQPKTLYASFREGGIYRSEDAGETWQKMDGGPGAPVRQFLHSDMEGSMQTGWLFAATPEGVRRSMDCFCGWRPTGELPKGEVLDVAYDPTQPKRVYASTANGLFRSADGGESWEQASAGPTAIALAVDATGTLFAADRAGALLRSTDQGRSWEQPRA